MRTNESELAKKKWLDTIKRWQEEWKKLAEETAIVPAIGGVHGLSLVSSHGFNLPGELRFRKRPK